MAKRRRPTSPLHDHARSKAQAAEEGDDEEGAPEGGGDEAEEERARAILHNRHERERSPWIKRGDDKVLKELDRAHAKERQDLEFDMRHRMMGEPAPGTESARAVKQREDDERGAKE